MTYTVKSTEAAWDLANKLFPTDYIHNPNTSERAGYPVYESTCSDYRFAHINDLCTRIEVVLEDYTCINIYIEEYASEAMTEIKDLPVEEQAKRLYKQIIRVIKAEGSAICSLFGVEYRFEYIDAFFGVELHINGRYEGDLTNAYEIYDLLLGCFEENS